MQLTKEYNTLGQQLVELPSKGVFTIKPDKYKVRIVACGNKTADTCVIQLCFAISFLGLLHRLIMPLRP